MSEQAKSKIVAGLEAALAFARGDTSAARVSVFHSPGEASEEPVKLTVFQRALLAVLDGRRFTSQTHHEMW